MIKKSKGGILIRERRKISLNNINYILLVSTYDNDKIKISLKNKDNIIDVTINLDVYLDNNHVFINPKIKRNGLLKELKKKRIIKEINDSIIYNNLEIPIATLNLGVIRKYDNKGVNNHFNKVRGNNG